MAVYKSDFSYVLSAAAAHNTTCMYYAVCVHMLILLNKTFIYSIIKRSITVI